MNHHPSIDQCDYYAIGILAASAIGSELTQSTLDSFHMAGIGDDLVIRGVPRIQELLHNSSSLNKIIFTIKHEMDEESIVYTNLAKILFDDILQIKQIEEVEWLNIWEMYYGPVQVPEESHILLKIRLCVKQQLKYKYDISKLKTFQWPNLITPIALSPIIQQNESFFNELIIACIYNEVALNELLNNYLAQETPFEHKLLYMREKVWIPRIKNLHLSGIPNVERLLKINNESLIVCNSFIELSDIIHIDPNNIISNKVSEMYNIFGIEVARRCLIEELCKIMNKILPCHVVTLVDKLTWSGVITAISRYTARKDDALKRISFEEAIRNIKVACEEGEIDKLCSISSCIVVSKRFV
jgi:hypothetical protein